jgi:glycosyltransferase involved in cell wall biosynthesis
VGVDGRELQGRPTGTGRYLRHLLRAWSTGTARLFVYFNGEAPPDPVLRSPTITCRPLPATRRGFWWSERRLPAAASADGVQVFFSPAYTCPLSLDVPRVTTVHDMSFFVIPEDFSVRDGLRRRVLVGASLRASRRVLAVSDFTRREIARLFPDLAGRVVAIPEAADDNLPPPPGRDAARARLGVAGPLLLTVGAIFNRRRLPTLLRAVARLRKAWPDLVLEVVGENRTQPRLDVAGMVADLELQRHVRVAGYVDDVQLAERYAAADVAVSLSEYEGFGLPTLEALSRGVPVVASARPALSELFGEAALLVDPADDAQLAAAVERVLREPGLRQDLVARGLALAARYSWADTARRTWAEIEGAR